MDEVHLPFHVSKKIQNNCPMSKVSSYFFNQLISSFNHVPRNMLEFIGDSIGTLCDVNLDTRRGRNYRLISFVNA